MRRRRNRSLNFINDISLRRKIEDAIEIASFLHLKRNERGTSKGFAIEICRMEILYAASIIEAVFLYLFKKRKEIMYKTDYKNVHTLPSVYQSATTSLLVVARQVQIPRADRELMLDNLLDFFFKKGLIKKRLKLKIDKARTVRNTFHLAKSRKGIRCNAVSVNTAYDTVIEVFSVARKLLK